MVTKIETLNVNCGEDAAARAEATALECLGQFEAARADWNDLFAVAPVSGYQAFDFVSAWFETVGRAQRVKPAILVARESSGRAKALFPLALNRRGPLTILTFMCGRESNFNLGLIRPGARFDEPALRDLLKKGAAAFGADIVYLRNQPRRFENFENPLALSCAGPSPSFAYGVTLPRDGAELDARVSKDTRKKLRKKEQRLAEFGELRYEHAVTGERAQDIMRTLISQKLARFAEMGIASAFNDQAMRDFLERSCAAPGAGALEVHALTVGGRVIATYAGLAHRGRFSAMLNSFDPEEAVARCSPGELLLRALLRNLVMRGFSRFDLGAGEARYKDAVCDETIELCDAVVPASWKGALAAPLFKAFLVAKRRVKQAPRVGRAATKARRLFRGAAR